MQVDVKRFNEVGNSVAKETTALVGKRLREEGIPTVEMMALATSIFGSCLANNILNSIEALEKMEAGDSHILGYKKAIVGDMNKLLKDTGMMIIMAS